MSLTAFQRYRRMKQVEEMKPENIAKVEEEEVKPDIVPEEPENEEVNEPLVPEEPATENEEKAEEVENFTDEPLVPDEEVKEEEPVEEAKEETKTDKRRKNNK